MALFAPVIIATILVIGWIINIIKLIGMDFDADITIEALLRIIGLVAFPLGTIMGYFV